MSIFLSFMLDTRHYSVIYLYKKTVLCPTLECVTLGCVLAPATDIFLLNCSLIPQAVRFIVIPSCL